MIRRLTFAAVAAAALTGCVAASSAGTTTFGQPLPHAARSWPDVTVQDDTGARWPVHQAVADWQIPVRFGVCDPTRPCIHVHEVTSLAGSAAGDTREKYGAGFPTQVNIYLADDVAGYYPEAPLQAACHELGHAYGLGHDITGGCLRPDVDGQHAYPSPAELTRLREMYLR